MTPREYLDQVVIPNQGDFAANYASLRHGLNAIATVDALAAHIYWALHASPTLPPLRRKNDDGFREYLASKDASFALVRDMAKAQKHVQILYAKGSQVPHASSVSAQAVGWGQLPFGRGRFGGPTQIVVQTSQGNADYVENIVDEAIKFLDGEMKANGL